LANRDALRAIALEHWHSDAFTVYGEVLDERRILIDRVLVPEAEKLPDWRDYDLIVAMGGPMSVNEEVEHPWLVWEKGFIREAVEAGIPYFGVCFGAQLLASSLQAEVYRGPAAELGLNPIFLTEAARRDRLFANLEGPELVFHWHGETFDLPVGAELLASSAACRNQAFRAGENVYGLQFHLEVTPDMIVDWCAQDANCGDMRELGTPIDPQRNAARLRELSAQIFGRWCDLLTIQAGESA